jgi:hypothetical protein
LRQRHDAQRQLLQMHQLWRHQRLLVRKMHFGIRILRILRLIWQIRIPIEKIFACEGRPATARCPLL